MKYLLSISFLFLAACSGGVGLNLGQYPDSDAAYDNFEYCHGYGCTKKIRLGFSDYEWKKISKIFKKKSKDAKNERVKIGEAIAFMEQYTGKLANTSDDLAKAPLRRQSYQELDCIDETINTTKYLRFLEQAGLLQFHQVGAPAFKGNLLAGVYPHNTAVVIEVATNTPYVIDSYIYANGERPNIRSLESWLKYRVEDIE